MTSGESETGFVKEINNGNQPKAIVLGDGSSILLQPRSSLQYPEIFAENSREIKLSGEAFFEISKDPKKPFIIYSEQLVTKVTGTSFTIRDFKNEDRALVQVKTGKVSVFSKAVVHSNNVVSGTNLDGVFLTPNQQVVFLRHEFRMIKSLVDNPSLLYSSVKPHFEFKDTPLRKVFAVIEESYGVEIVYDEELMGNCALNASLDDMPLYDKVRLICKGVNAKYEILDSRIIITGKGCR